MVGTYVSRGVDSTAHYNDFLDSQECLWVLGCCDSEIR